MPGSEVFYSDTPPEAFDTIENKRHTVSNGSAGPTSRALSPRILIIVTAIIATVLVGTAVGVGVGVGLRKQKSSSGPSTLVASTVTRIAPGRYNATSWPSRAQCTNLSSSSSTDPTHAPLLTNRRILDDTSIAALALPDGGRRLFFQDQSGVIRQASYTSSSKEWRAGIDIVVASNAKNHTPIAVLIPPEAPWPAAGNVNRPFAWLSLLCFAHAEHETARSLLHTREQQSCL